MDLYFTQDASIASDISSFEARLAKSLPSSRPDGSFKADLKTRLASARIYRQRRELGARLVAAFSVLILAILAYGLGTLLRGRGADQT